jgi:5-methylcytosine-specific restriction enzyme A
VPSQTWHQHRRFCFDQQSARRAHSSSAQWKRLRQQILERDGHQCTAIVDGRRCQVTEGLQVAHIAGDWRDDNPSGLTTLCQPCHAWFDAARS